MSTPMPPDGVPEGSPSSTAGTPPVQFTTTAPQTATGPIPQQDDDVLEFQTRDRLTLALAIGAERMVSAAEMAAESNDADAAESFATAAQRLTQAHVLVSPIEAADDVATRSGQGAATPGYIQALDTATKGVRRTVS